MTTEAEVADEVPEPDVGAPEVTFPETGKALDVGVPPVVPELPEGSAVTVTVGSADKVPEPEAGVVARVSDVLAPSVDEVPLEGPAVTVITKAAEDVPEPEAGLVAGV